MEGVWVGCVCVGCGGCELWRVCGWDVCVWVVEGVSCGGCEGSYMYSIIGPGFSIQVVSVPLLVVSSIHCHSFSLQADGVYRKSFLATQSVSLPVSVCVCV